MHFQWWIRFQLMFQLPPLELARCYITVCGFDELHQKCTSQVDATGRRVGEGSLRSTMMNVITIPVSFLGAQSKPCSSFSMFSTKKKKACGLACVCDLWASNSSKEVVCTFACARLRVLDWAWPKGWCQ